MAGTIAHKLYVRHQLLERMPTPGKENYIYFTLVVTRWQVAPNNVVSQTNVSKQNSPRRCTKGSSRASTRIRYRRNIPKSSKKNITVIFASYLLLYRNTCDTHRVTKLNCIV